MKQKTVKFSSKSKVIDLAFKGLQDLEASIFWSNTDELTTKSGWSIFTKSFFNSYFLDISEFIIDINEILYIITYSNYKIKLQPL